MALRPRSKFWIVSRHVVIAGFVLPGVAHAAAVGAIRAFRLQVPPAYLSFLAILAFGYFAGFGNSLKYLRKNALSDRWMQCALPAIFSFAALCVLAFAADVYWLPEKNLWTLTGLAVLYSVVIRAFSTITKRAFEAFQRRVAPPSGVSGEGRARRPPIAIQLRPPNVARRRAQRARSHHWPTM